MAFLACVHLALFVALSPSPGNSLVSSWCDHSMLVSLLLRRYDLVMSPNPPHHRRQKDLQLRRYVITAISCGDGASSRAWLIHSAAAIDRSATSVRENVQPITQKRKSHVFPFGKNVKKRYVRIFQRRLCMRDRAAFSRHSSTL